MVEKLDTRLLLLGAIGILAAGLVLETIVFGAYASYWLIPSRTHAVGYVL